MRAKLSTSTVAGTITRVVTEMATSTTSGAPLSPSQRISSLAGNSIILAAVATLLVAAALAARR